MTTSHLVIRIPSGQRLGSPATFSMWCWKTLSSGVFSMFGNFGRLSWTHPHHGRRMPRFFLWFRHDVTNCLRKNCPCISINTNYIADVDTNRAAIPSTTSYKTNLQLRLTTIGIRRDSLVGQTFKRLSEVHDFSEEPWSLQRTSPWRPAGFRWDRPFRIGVPDDWRLPYSGHHS